MLLGIFLFHAMNYIDLVKCIVIRNKRNTKDSTRICANGSKQCFCSFCVLKAAQTMRSFLSVFYSSQNLFNIFELSTLLMSLIMDNFVPFCHFVKFITLPESHVIHEALMIKSLSIVSTISVTTFSNKFKIALSIEPCENLWI